MSQSHFQRIVRCLMAAGYAMDSPSLNEEVDLLYVNGPALTLKHWTGNSFITEELVTPDVRPNSSAACFFTVDLDIIVCINYSSAIHILKYDRDEGEWISRDDVPHYPVHPKGTLAAWMNVDGALHIFFQDPSHRLIYLHMRRGNPTAFPVSPIVGSPIFVNAVKGEIYAFYISAADHYIHYISVNPDTGHASGDSVMSRCKITEHIKHFLMAINQEQSFDAYLLTEERALLHISADGRKTVLGKADAVGTFISERIVDRCSNEAFNGTLTEYDLASYLESDPSIINSPGGEQNVTPLAAACWGGHLEIVELLLAKEADTNAVSPQNRTALLLAVSRSPPSNRRLIVRALLDAGAEIDKCYAENDLNTPLMTAIITGTSDKDVIDELIKRGASLMAKNAQGLTPGMLAGGRGLESISVLQPHKTTDLSQFHKQLIEFVTALIMLIVTYTNSQDILDDILSDLSGMEGFDDITRAAR